MLSIFVCSTFEQHQIYVHFSKTKTIHFAIFLGFSTIVVKSYYNYSKFCTYKCYMVRILGVVVMKYVSIHLRINLAVLFNKLTSLVFTSFLLSNDILNRTFTILST